jgi:DNA-binding MarR family transcriptional regulator
VEVRETIARVLELYPRIHFACHARRVADAASRRTLSRHQASILDHLDPGRPVRLAELASGMGVTPSTMSLNVARLVRRSLVLRDRDPADRRALRLRLSPAGARLRAARSLLDPERVRRIVSKLTPEDRQQSVRGLEILARAARGSIEV